MSKGSFLAALLLAFLTTGTVASAQSAAGEVIHAPIIKRGVSFLQNAPAATLGPMKAPQQADRQTDLIRAMRGSMHAAAPGANLEVPMANTSAGVVQGGTAVTFNGLDVVDQEFVNRIDLEPPDQGI